MRGVLIIGYGTTYPDTERMIRKYCFNLASQRPEKIYFAFYRTNYVTIPDIIRTLPYNNVDELLVIPATVSNGKVATISMPKQVGLKSVTDNTLEIGENTIKVIWDCSIGTDPDFPRIFTDFLRKEPVDPGSTVVLVGYGIKRHSYIGVLNNLADKLREEGYSHTTTSFMDEEGFDMTTGFDEAVSSGSNCVAIFPMFLSCGIHARGEICNKLGLNSYTYNGIYVHNGVPVKTSVLTPLGMTEVVSETIMAKVRRHFGD